MSLLNDASLVFIPSGYKEDKVYSIIPSNGAGDLDFVRGCDATRINPQSLVEGTPWNLLTYSEDFTNGIWTKTDVTITANSAIAPNGTNTADLFTTNNASGSVYRAYAVATTSGQFIKTISGYFKYTNHQYAFIVGDNYSGAGQFAVFDLINGTNTFVSSGYTATISSVGSGWFYCTFSGAMNTDVYTQFGLAPASNTYAGISIANGKTLLVWGAQLNIGSTAKPYFPTTDRLNVPRLTYSPTLIERQSTNLALYSNAFSTSPWSNILDTGATLTYTANYGSAPDGTLTAGRLQMALNGSNFAQKNQIISVLNGQTYTYSIWIKSLSGTKDIVFCYDNTNNIHATVTETWTRFQHTFTGNSQVYCRFVLEAGTSTSVDLLVYGAQLETGALSSYIPTTSTAVTRTATYNSGCPSLLLEKQSTNYAVWSEDFSNASWDKIDATITSNASISPDGTMNADRMYEAATSGNHGFYKNLNISTGTDYSFSCYVKKGNIRYCGLQMWYSTNIGSIAFFDLDNGTLLYEFEENQFSSGYDIKNSKITSVGNDWYRLEATIQVGITDSYFGIVMANSLWTTGTSYDNPYTGDTSKYLDIWGFQIEQSSYPTSYIPTTSATATRLADSCYKTGISSLIGQTSGTVFADFYLISGYDNNQMVLTLSDNTSSNFIIIQRYLGSMGCRIDANGAVQVDSYTTFTNSGRHKIALAYASNDVKVYLDGSAIITDTSITVPAMSKINIGSFYDETLQLGSSINEVVLFPTRLTNAELASLTTI